MLNVLHVSAGNLYGGVEALLVTLARERACCPVLNSHFALCFKGRISEELEVSGSPAIQLGSVRIRHPWTILLARRRLARVLDENHYDAVICHMSWTHAIFAPVVRRAGIPLFFWMHNVADGSSWLERWAAQTPPDFVFANSQYSANTLPSLFKQNVPFDTFTNAVSSDNFQSLTSFRETVRAQFKTPADAKVIIQVSRLEPWKGQRQLLEALSLIKELSDWTCWIVGGAQRLQEEVFLDELKSLAERFGIAERVRFLGWQPDVRKLLRAADIFCQANPSPEPWGRVFVEAMYAGLPTIGTCVGGAVEIIDSSCGRLVQPDNPKALAAVFRELLLNSTLRLQLSTNGPKRATALTSPEKVLVNIAEKIQAVCSGKKSKH